MSKRACVERAVTCLALATLALAVSAGEPKAQLSQCPEEPFSALLCRKYPEAYRELERQYYEARELQNQWGGPTPPVQIQPTEPTHSSNGGRR